MQNSWDTIRNGVFYTTLVYHTRHVNKMIYYARDKESQLEEKEYGKYFSCICISFINCIKNSSQKVT